MSVTFLKCLLFFQTLLGNSLQVDVSGFQDSVWTAIKEKYKAEVSVPILSSSTTVPADQMIPFWELIFSVGGVECSGMRWETQCLSLVNHAATYLQWLWDKTTLGEEILFVLHVHLPTGWSFGGFVESGMLVYSLCGLLENNCVHSLFGFDCVLGLEWLHLPGKI